GEEIVDSSVEFGAQEGQLRTDVWDLFNDKPCWTCQTWVDLKRLNDDLHAIVNKFELLDHDNVKVKNELLKYLQNFEVIKETLSRFERRLCIQTREKSPENDNQRFNQEASCRKVGEDAADRSSLSMTTRNIYDDATFFAGYSRLPRSV